VQVKEALKATLKDKFAFINLDEITVSDIKKEDKEAKVSVENFTEKVTVKFDINEEKNLDDVIKTTSLGQITIEATNAEITPKQVKEALRNVEANKTAMEKAKVTDDEITIEEITDTTAIIKINDYSKSKKVTFTVKQSVASVIVNTTAFVVNKANVTEAEAKEAIYKANKETMDAAEIAKDSLTVTLDPKAGTADVKINKTKFDDKVVKVTFENKIVLKTLVENDKIVVDNAEKVTDDQLKDAILKANPKLDQIKGDLTFAYDKTKKTVTVTSTLDKYTSEAATFTYTTKEVVKEVGSVISDADLKISINKEGQEVSITDLKNEILKVNKDALKSAGIEAEQVIVEKVNEKTVKVTFAPETKYTGNVVIKFSTELKPADEGNTQDGSKTAPSRI